MKCQAYTTYRTLDGDTKIIRGEGDTPEHAIEDAAKNGYDCVDMLIDGVPVYEENGRWLCD